MKYKNDRFFQTSIKFRRDGLKEKIPGVFFVGIGAQRCGTTWIYHLLKRHPDVYLSDIKELHYFDTKYLNHCRIFDGIFKQDYDKITKNLVVRIRSYLFRWRYVKALKCRIRMKSDGDYLKFFSASKCKAFGDITPSYSMLPEEGFRNISQLFPSCKIIFGMRNPSDRIWSHWRLQKHLFPKDTFYADPNNLMVFKDQPTVIERTLYDKTLKKIYAVFDEKNIITYFFEDLFRDRHAARNFITELAKFLEIPVTKKCLELFDQKFGAVPSEQMPVEYREQLNREYLNTIIQVKERIGRVPPEWKTGD